MIVLDSALTIACCWTNEREHRKNCKGRIYDWLVITRATGDPVCRYESRTVFVVFDKSTGPVHRICVVMISGPMGFESLSNGQ